MGWRKIYINGKDCHGKAKFGRKTGKVIIYERCNNEKYKHNKIIFDEFLKLYQKKELNNINMELTIYQKFFIKCLIMENKVHNYVEALESFKTRFLNIQFLISE